MYPVIIPAAGDLQFFQYLFGVQGEITRVIAVRGPSYFQATIVVGLWAGVSDF